MQKLNRKVIITIFISSTIVFLANCNQSKEANSNLNGEKLSKLHCVSCHTYPKPNLLDKNSWKDFILPRMKEMMADVDLDTNSWEKIERYYCNEAPLKLPLIDSQNILIGLKYFKIKYPPLKLSPPSTTMVNFLPDGNILLGDAHTKSLLFLDSSLQIKQAANVGEGIVSNFETENDYWLTVMGSFSPNDNPDGFILKLAKNSETGQTKKVVSNLKRPVHSSFGDINNDGKTDIVISEFGKWEGQLSLHLNNGNDTFTKSVLVNQTGAIKSHLHDFNKDGKVDIIALFGQGKECIYILYNEGDNKFRKEEVISFSPSHGSSNFNLTDMNGDDHLDIIYTAGDNADFNPILKPYHGIYIFENDGQNNFEESFFYHLNGAYDAQPFDYDMDGDLDIAAISFFPDYTKGGQEGFMYLENLSDNNYVPYTFENILAGRWIVMDRADTDEDGDMDIILGSLAFEVIPKIGI